MFWITDWSKLLSEMKGCLRATSLEERKTSCNSTNDEDGDQNQLAAETKSDKLSSSLLPKFRSRNYLVS